MVPWLFSSISLGNHCSEPKIFRLYITIGVAIACIAKELLSRVVEEARNYGCGNGQITASDMGVKLYTAFGFNDFKISEYVTPVDNIKSSYI